MLMLGMFSIYFDGVINAHMGEQQEVHVEGLSNFSTQPGCKTLTNSKTSQTAQRVIKWCLHCYPILTVQKVSQQHHRLSLCRIILGFLICLSLWKLFLLICYQVLVPLLYEHVCKRRQAFFLLPEKPVFQLAPAL